MNAVAIADVPRGNTDTFGGLLREGETPEQGLRRLEKRRNYTKVIGTDEGQRLLAAATAQATIARNRASVPRTDGPLAGYSESAAAALEGFKQDVPADVPARHSTKARAVTLLEVDGALVCTGSNHVAGHTPRCPQYVAPMPAAPAETAAPSPSRGSSVAAQLMDLPLDLVDVGENVRTDPGDLEGLAASIKDVGVQQPIVAVGPGADGRYRAVNGQRRILASRLAELPTIPAVVYLSSELDVAGPRRSIAQLAENLQRKAMNPIEEAIALKSALDGRPGLTQAALAGQIGISEPTLSSTLALLRAPAKVQDLVRTEKVSIAHAKAVAGLPADEQVRLIESAVSNGVSAHSLEDTAKYSRRQEADRVADSRRTADAAKRGLAALEKAGTPKDAQLFVNAEHWQIQDADVRKVIKAAGYQVADGWAYGGERWSKCDCAALRLHIRDGEGSTIVTVCTSDAHRRAWEKERTAKADERRAGEEAARKALTKAVRAAMPTDLNPTVGRLILKILDGYGGKAWAEYAKLSATDVVKAIADKLTSEQALRGSNYNGEAKSVPVKTLLKELGADVAAPAPTGKHPRRRSPEAVAADVGTANAGAHVDAKAVAAAVLAEGDA